MAAGTLYLGTSGWSYVHWGKGAFYPRGLKPTEWLRHYAGEFSTVEINASFYRLPKPETVARWCEATPPGFRFAIKLWRRITHERRLLNCGDDLHRFMEVAQVLGPKRGPLLVQLPPTLRADPPRLDDFLAEVRTATSASPWRVAVEFRHASWLSPATEEILDRHNAAGVLADKPECLTAQPNRARPDAPAPFVYVRRHGPAGSHTACYTDSDLALDADHVRRWLAEGREVYVYFNNDVHAHAIHNARRLSQLITGRSAVEQVPGEGRLF